MKIYMLIGGIALASVGYDNYTVTRGSTTEPDQVALADLASGAKLENKHVAVGDHYAVYQGVVYTALGVDEGAEPTDDAIVAHAYYPIVPRSHPYADLCRERAENGAPDDSEVAEALAGLGDVTVLVKTDRFARVRDIYATSWPGEDVAAVQGMIVNEIDSLDEDEVALMQSAFPSIDLDSVLILEEGRKPSGGLQTLGMMAGGALLSLGTLFSMLGRLGKSQPQEQAAAA